MEKYSTVILVVAAAIFDSAGKILMQRRPLEKAHGGLWEFPGGKVEPGESPESALLREIDEELGIALDPAGLFPLTFASDPALPPAPRAPHVILLYTCSTWRGKPHCREGGELDWFAPEALEGLEMPPLDYPLARMVISSILPLAKL